jgi:hypothetical protein
MRTTFAITLLSVLGMWSAFASDDPVKDYLSLPVSYLRNPGYYSTDQVFRIDLDLRHNGETVTLVTFNRDRDGQQGNIWVVYRKTPEGYKSIGTMTFDTSFLHLGWIHQMHAYGAATIGHAGGEQGSIDAYVDEGESIREKSISGVHHFWYLKRMGSPFARYFENSLPKLKQKIQMIDAKQLAEKYGLHIEKESYEEAGMNGFKGIPTK